MRFNHQRQTDQTGTRLEIDTNGQPDRNRDGRGDHEPDDGLGAELERPAPRPFLAMTQSRNGSCNSEENQRRHQHLDGTDKDVADRVQHRQGRLAPVKRHGDAQRESNQGFQPERNFAEPCHDDYFRVQPVMRIYEPRPGDLHTKKIAP